MSIIKQWLSGFFATLLSSDCAPADTDGMSVRDWADLPVHHPVRDSAPC